jgi:hypothetical protein
MGSGSTWAHMSRSPRSALYRWARLLGDAQAIKRGPGAIARREGRRTVYRKVNRTTATLLRKAGLL